MNITYYFWRTKANGKTINAKNIFRGQPTSGYEEEERRKHNTKCISLAAHARPSSQAAYVHFVKFILMFAHDAATCLHLGILDYTGRLNKKKP